jgi:hypothetical protein
VIDRGRAQRGSVSIVVAGLATVALVASLGVADVGKALVARARARAAADAAALAAAQELALPGGRTPVELADSTAAHWRRHAPISCDSCAGTLAAEVEVEVAIGPMFLAADGLTRSARARCGREYAGRLDLASVWILRAGVLAQRRPIGSRSVPRRCIGR